MVRADTVIATLVLVLCVIGAQSSFESILGRERPATPIEALRAGEYRYALSFRGQCFADLRYQLTYDGGYSLFMDSKFDVQTAGEQQSVIFSTQVYFNALGQFTGGLILLRNPIGRVEVISEGVNPFEVELNIARTGKGNVWSMKRSFPGPVELIDMGGNESFRVQYRPQVFDRVLGAELERGGTRLLGAITPYFEVRDLSLEDDTVDCTAPLTLEALAPLLISQGLSGIGREYSSLSGFLLGQGGRNQ